MDKSREIELRTSISQLHDKFEFDLKIGAIYNKRTGNRVDIVHHFAGQSSSNTRYKQINYYFQGTTYKLSAHRVIWAIVNKKWPDDGVVIDHINSDTHDNRPSNLRAITRAGNAARVNQKQLVDEIQKQSYEVLQKLCKQELDVEGLNKFFSEKGNLLNEEDLLHLKEWFLKFSPLKCFEGSELKGKKVFIFSMCKPENENMASWVDQFRLIDAYKQKWNEL